MTQGETKSGGLPTGAASAPLNFLRSSKKYMTRISGQGGLLG